MIAFKFLMLMTWLILQSLYVFVVVKNKLKYLICIYFFVRVKKIILEWFINKSDINFSWGLINFFHVWFIYGMIAFKFLMLMTWLILQWLYVFVVVKNKIKCLICI